MNISKAFLYKDSMKSEFLNLSLSTTLTLPSNSSAQKVTEILFVLARGSICSATIILF